MILKKAGAKIPARISGAFLGGLLPQPLHLILQAEFFELHSDDLIVIRAGPVVFLANAHVQAGMALF
jgi:hypothetical protein